MLAGVVEISCTVGKKPVYHYLKYVLVIVTFVLKWYLAHGTNSAKWHGI